MQVRLLADHTVAAHFLDLAVRIRDEPATRQQLRGNLPLVADGDRVGEHVAVLFRLGLLLEIVGLDVDADLVNDGFHLPASLPYGRLECLRERVELVRSKHLRTRT